MTFSLGEIEAAVALTALQSPKTTNEKLPTPPSSDDEENPNHPNIDRLHSISKDETIQQMKNFSRRELFYIYLWI